MNFSVFTLAAMAIISLSLPATAADHANANGSKENPASSTAATSKNKEHSPGTVGSMNDAGGGSFTASDKDKKGVDLGSNK